MPPPDADLYPEASGLAKPLVDEHQAEQPLKLFVGWFCPFVQRVWITLEEKGIPYQYIECNPYHKPESLLRLNPRGLVHALQYEDKPLYESTVVCEFLEDAYPDHGLQLLPRDPYVKARMRIWIDFVSTRVTPAFHRFLHVQSKDSSIDTVRSEFLQTLRFAGAISESARFCLNSTDQTAKLPYLFQPSNRIDELDALVLAVYGHERAIGPLPDPIEPLMFDEMMANLSDYDEYNYGERTDTSTLSNIYQDYPPSASKPECSQVKVIDPKVLDLETSYQSPGSSPVSSSDFSNTHHERDRSSGSSLTDDAPVVGRKSMDNVIATTQDNEDSFMDSAFDFENAASSPTEQTNSSLFPTSVLMRSPFVLNSDTFNGDHDRRSDALRMEGNIKEDLTPRTINNTRTVLPLRQHGGTPSMDTSGIHHGVSEVYSHRPLYEWPSAAAGESRVANPSAGDTGLQHPTSGPFGSPRTINPIPGSYVKMSISPIGVKTRVENQIEVHIAIEAIPPSVNKLHLQSHTVTKAKQLAKQKPHNDPNTLELHAMLVCSSAMNDPIKCDLAFARAGGPRPFFLSKLDSSSENVNSSDDDDDDECKAADGGPVRLCRPCIEREIKRVARNQKPTKIHKQTIENLKLWEGDASNRAILFNANEIIERSGTSLPKKGCKSQGSSSPEDQSKAPDDAFLVNLPMRITCYCRHQDEKVGYRVIFTLRNYLDNVLAQVMTSNIIITDDHKTTATSRASQPEGIGLPQGAGLPMGSPFLSRFHWPAFHRNAYSTNDLQGMQHQHTVGQTDPSATRQIDSQMTSTAPTPKALSRPASPPGSSEPRYKRRKAGSSGRIPHGLTMTKLQSPVASNMQSPGVSSASEKGGFRNGWAAEGPTHDFKPSFFPGMSDSSQYSTNQSTPSPPESKFTGVDPQSQSVDHFPSQAATLSAPTSMPTSRIPSPPAGSHWNGASQEHAQMLVNSLASLSTAVPPRPPPLIHITTPKEGSRSGGTEVICLGTGFHDGLQVMFGDVQATQTTCWSETALHCITPPAQQADLVYVTLRNVYEESIVVPPTQLTTFRYLNDDEQVLMKHALALISQQYQGQNADPAATARNVIQHFGASLPFTNGSSQGSHGQRQVPGAIHSGETSMSLEAAALGCLELVDLDDSPYQANLDAQDSNGQSLLHLSSSLGYYRMTAALLARGANPDLRDRNGLSPMHTASLRGHQQIIRKLRSAGGDPTMRTLNGFTPIDMASCQMSRNAINALNSHSRSMSAGVTPTTPLSRASSVKSTRSDRGVHTPGNDIKANAERHDPTVFKPYNEQPVTPAQMYSRSRRSSLAPEQQSHVDDTQPDMITSSSLVATSPALSAWIDQISTQIQQLQQTVHRTLPNLQIPTLPPIPAIPDYQAYPVMRRISSLVPQRSSKPNVDNSSLGSAKEGDSRWWDFITGSNLSPPAYEEIYPTNAERDTDKKLPILHATGEAFLNRKFEAAFDNGIVPSVGSKLDPESSITNTRERELLRNSPKTDVKRLRSDRKLFFFWIPLLILVLVATLKDQLPQAARVAYQVFDYVQEGFGDRVVEVA